MQINKEMYFEESQNWWDNSNDSPFAFLRHIVNPVRFSYFKRIITENFPGGWTRKTLLDLGCGGGYLSEEFAKMGIDVTGMDPSPVLVKAAQEHADQSSLSIRYIVGYGENIPLPENSFDFVACCDVLEHVDDLEKVIHEVSRVLKPGGLFFFDTINRTFKSYLFAIKIAQDWKFSAWEQPRTHVWNKFIKSEELNEIMGKNGLTNRELTGISPRKNLVICFIKIIQRARGNISRHEMGMGLNLGESNDTSVQYLGFAQKNTPA